jgi:hypothetical protein
MSAPPNFPAIEVKISLKLSAGLRCATSLCKFEPANAYIRPNGAGKPLFAPLMRHFASHQWEIFIMAIAARGLVLHPPPAPA